MSFGRGALLLLLLAGLGFWGPVSGIADEPDATPPLQVEYHTSTEVHAELDLLASAAEVAGLPGSIRRYGTSAGGRPLCALRLGRAVPTVLVHGGLGPRDAAATVACLDLGRRLLADPALTAGLSWVLVPAPNPDALDAFLAGAPPDGGGAWDRDRDGRAGEDGPADIDGDGEILWMRRSSTRGAWVPATDARLLVEKGVDARRDVSYERLDEGLDADGDGALNEDPPALDLERQLAGYWDDKKPWRGDGPFAGYAPEAKALMDLSLEATGLVAWYGFTGSGAWILRANEQGKLADRDDALYGELGRALEARDETGRRVKRARDILGKARNPGSDLDWAAVHLGVPAFRIPVWWIAKEEGDDRKREVADEHDWLRWNDRVLEGAGFVAWHPFDHPTLGPVELGGWRRFTRFEPPADLLSDVVAKVGAGPLAHVGFHAVLAAEVEVDTRGDGLHAVEVRVLNRGGGPTDTALAARRRLATRIRVVFEPAADATILAGRAEQNEARLGPGAASEPPLQWLVRAPVDDSGRRGPLGTIRIRHPKADPVDVEVKAP